MSTHLTPEPSCFQLIPKVGLILVILLTFLFVIIFAYLPTRGPIVGAPLVEQRTKNLQELQLHQHKLVSEYAWVDEELKIVRIPIEKAMQLVITEYSTAQY